MAFVNTSISISDPAAELTYYTFTRTFDRVQTDLPISVGAGTPGFSDDTILIEIVSMIVYNPNNYPVSCILSWNSTTPHFTFTVGAQENLAVIKQSQPIYTTVQELRFEVETNAHGPGAPTNVASRVSATISYKQYEVS